MPPPQMSLGWMTHVCFFLFSHPYSSIMEMSLLKIQMVDPHWFLSSQKYKALYCRKGGWLNNPFSFSKDHLDMLLQVRAGAESTSSSVNEMKCHFNEWNEIHLLGEWKLGFLRQAVAFHLLFWQSLLHHSPLCLVIFLPFNWSTHQCIYFSSENHGDLQMIIWKSWSFWNHPVVSGLPCALI